jgi:iron complex outermembrane receptor protein
MYIRYVIALLSFLLPFFLWSQEADTLKEYRTGEVTVTASRRKAVERSSPIAVTHVDTSFLAAHFSGNLVRTLARLPGVTSMDIGAGYSKPAIRGMGFNRVVVSESGVKHEGQQWGADHGLETDAFNASEVVVRKGPSSLVYGSDAMGGAIEIIPMPAPSDNQVFGDASVLGKSVNGLLGGSLMLGVKKEDVYIKMRYSEQHFGDYSIPADTVVYLTQRMPIAGRRLKNTAGLERDISMYSEYRRGGYTSSYLASNTFQQVGFFSGAHGIPDVSSLADDGDSRNIDTPYSAVNHLKLSTRQQYVRGMAKVMLDVGYQSNDREEISLFHTHYGNQPAPETDPDKELIFHLNTFSTSIKADMLVSEKWRHTVGVDIQAQRNEIAGYSFLLPAFRRTTAGCLWLSVYRPSAENISISGGLRYDYGRMNISAFRDNYLEDYLRSHAYSDDIIEAYKWRSYPVDKSFGDISGSLGMVWEMDKSNVLKINIGRSFRLPGANELASNGVHHGAFRHEQGDPLLSSEKGWQLDFSYFGKPSGGKLEFSLSPFVSLFNNYIYLKPTGMWSLLPHAGQIYRYTEAEAFFAGAEAEFSASISRGLMYSITGEYVYTHNLSEHTPLSFSPPLSIRNTLAYALKKYSFNIEIQTVASQSRVAHNEDPTPGANLLHVGASTELPFGGSVSLVINNLLNTAYLNHLSFYRKAEIPEPGRNVQLFIKIPIKYKIK